MHFAPLITLSGIALSGVPMTSSKTFDEASNLFAISDWSLSSAAQPANQQRTNAQHQETSSQILWHRLFSLSVLHVSTCYLTATLSYRLPPSRPITDLAVNKPISLPRFSEIHGSAGSEPKPPYRFHGIVMHFGRRLLCNLYSTQRPPSGCRSSGTDWHPLLLFWRDFYSKIGTELQVRSDTTACSLWLSCKRFQL